MSGTLHHKLKEDDDYDVFVMKKEKRSKINILLVDIDFGLLL
jgi:hypothetical protein